MDDIILQITPDLISFQRGDSILCLSDVIDNVVELNGTSVFIWNQLSEKPCSLSDIHKLIEQEFDGYYEDEIASVEAFIKKLIDLEIIKEKK